MADNRRDVTLRISRGLRDLLAQAGPAQQALAAKLGIGVTDARALQHLAEASSPAGTVELSTLLGIRSASATVLVDRLETAGHLRRQPHPSDGRRVALSVTASAQEQVREALAPLLRDIAGLVDQLTPEQAETVATFLDSAVAMMRRYSQDSV